MPWAALICQEHVRCRRGGGACFDTARLTRHACVQGRRCRVGGAAADCPPPPGAACATRCSMALEKLPCGVYAMPRFPYSESPPSPARSPTSCAIARRCVWCSMELEKSPCEPYALLRFPYAPPSSARSRISFAIASFCVWYSWPWKSPPATDTQSRGSSSRTPGPPPPNRLPPLHSPGPAYGTR